MAAARAVAVARAVGSGGGSGGGSGSGNATVNGACEQWCTDQSCMMIHFTDDFDECMLGCTTEQHTPPCDGSYGTYISCLAAAGCAAPCTTETLRWAACEDGSDAPIGGNGSDESLTQVCQADSVCRGPCGDEATAFSSCAVN